MKVLDILNRAEQHHGLAGKVVAVWFRTPETGGIYRDVRIVKVGFHAFLVGRHVSRIPSGDSLDDVESWIAIGEINRLMVFDTVESARRVLAPESPPLEPTA